ncbi:MAG TPA: STAS/SEC14 domain-containing protein [Chthoniobacterales bacterium]|nr:STAS/SEC14 domain-containing protein [Chthoniobacterales bacterium]
MSLQVEYEPADVCVLHISGTLKRSEFAATQQDIARKIDVGSKPRVLAILNDFDGWERGADWNDLDFLITHGGEIARIAVVGDPRWEVKALAFGGAGVRRTPVKFFPSGELQQARTWLTT